MLTETLKESQPYELHVLRTDMGFLEAGWIGAGGSRKSSDRNFPIASHMEN
jgi:hypothetical protein